MAAASPPPLPTAVSSADVAAAAANPAAARVFVSRLLDSARRAFSGARPNYAAVVALSLAATLLAHPFSLGSLMFSALALGAAVVCARSAFRVPEDHFPDVPDQAAGSGNQPDEDDDGGSSAAVLLLPDDILADVLRRLPPRSLAASRCVRKQWCSIIDVRRMLRVDLLPLQLDGFFGNPNDYEHRPSFFAPPSTMRRIITAGRLSDFFDTFGYMSIADHCNGLLLHGLGQLTVVNPATRQWAALPAFPSPSASSSSSVVDDQLLQSVGNQLIVYDPMVSPQHYEVFVIPIFYTYTTSDGDGDGDGDDETQTQHLAADYSADQYWPPSPYTIHVFSSRKWMWEERSFVRQGDPAGTIADMLSCSDSRSLEEQGVYFQEALYVRCRNDSVIRYLYSPLCLYIVN